MPDSLQDATVSTQYLGETGWSEVEARLAFAAPACKPAPSLRQRLLVQIRTQPQAQSPALQKSRLLSGFVEDIPGFHILRSGEGKWRASRHAGVDFKVLSRDPASDAVTFLMRMAPGSHYPQHVHSIEEQCWVLEGDVAHCNGQVKMRAGDFIRAMPGTVHTSISTESGCLLLIIASAGDDA